MRISITSSKDVIEGLKPAMDQIDRIEAGGDRTELPFGLTEIATIVGIASGMASLIKTILEIAKRPGQQRLIVKSAGGSVILEVDAEVQAEDLQQQLQGIFPPK